jgi:hypothetical protein
MISRKVQGLTFGLEQKSLQAEKHSMQIKNVNMLGTDELLLIYVICTLHYRQQLPPRSVENMGLL